MTSDQAQYVADQKFGLIAHVTKNKCELMNFPTLICRSTFVVFSRCHQSCRIQSALRALAPYQTIFIVFSKVHVRFHITWILEKRFCLSIYK